MVVLIGARQAGENRLLINAEPACNWYFFIMDDYNVLQQASQEPEVPLLAE